MQTESSQPPQPLDYEAPRSSYSAALTPFRIVAFVALTACGYYISVNLRCYGAGFSPHATLFATLIFVGPFACAAFLGMRWKRYMAVVLAALLLPAIVAEAQATLEEKLFLISVKNLPPATPVVFKPQRWWPAENSYLYFDPATGELGGGD